MMDGGPATGLLPDKAGGEADPVFPFGRLKQIDLPAVSTPFAVGRHTPINMGRQR